MKKKITALLLVVALVAVAVAGSTMAYFTDTAQDVNVATVGNVKIEQHEYQRAEGVPYDAGEMGAGNGVKKGALVPYVQGRPLFPAVPKDSTAYTAEMDTNKLFFWGDYVYSGTAGNGLWNDDKLANVHDKMVFVENTGKSDLYFRTIIAFECPEGMEYSEGSDKQFMMNTNIGTYDWESAGYIEIDGTRYLVHYATYQNVLKPGQTSHPSLLQVIMTDRVGNEEAAKLGDTYEILVFTQAVQAAGFDNAEQALNAAFGDITTTNHPWAELALAADADELIEALESGKDVVLLDDVKINPAGMSNAYGTTGINVKNGQTIDGNGNTLDIKGAGGTWDSGINTTGGLIKDLTVTGSFRGIFINHNSTHSERVVLENVIIDGTTYTISCDQGMNQGLTATNSTFNGWTSYAGTLGDAKFVDCNFGYGNGYRFMRPYAPTEFVGCHFEAGYTVDPRAAVTFENCYLDGVLITADNVDDLVTSTANVTVK